jgi:hypothetical protein
MLAFHRLDCIIVSSAKFRVVRRVYALRFDDSKQIREKSTCAQQKILKSTGTLTLDTGILQTYIGANGAEVRG